MKDVKGRSQVRNERRRRIYTGEGYTQLRDIRCRKIFTVEEIFTAKGLTRLGNDRTDTFVSLKQ